MRDQLLQRLPALLQRGLGLLVRPVEEAGGPALVAQLCGDVDQEARLAEPAGAMEQAAGGGARDGAPALQLGRHAGDVGVENEGVPGLQQLARGDLARVARQLLLLWVEQAMAVLAKVDLVQRDPGRNRRAVPDLGDGGEDAGVVRGVVDVVDVEGLGDVAEAHLRGADVDQLALLQSAQCLGVDVVGDHGTGGPDHDHDAGLVEGGTDLGHVRRATLQLLVPPDRACAILGFKDGDELAGKVAVLGRIANEYGLDGRIEPSPRLCACN